MKKKFVVTLLCCLFMIGIFTACNDPQKGSGMQTPAEYTVTFDLNGGSFADNRMNTVQVESGTVLDLSTYAPQLTGSTFDSWKSGEIFYAANGKITVNGDLTLTAQWKKNSYTVTFHVGNGTLAETTATLEHGAQLELSDHIPVPKNAEYEHFVCWKDSDTTYQNDAKISVTQNMELTAVYEPNVSDLSMFTFSEPENGEVTLTGVSQDFALTVVVLPACDDRGNQITAIGKNAFSSGKTEQNDQVKAITAIYLDGMTYLRSIESGAFAQMPALETISLCGLKNLTRIGSGAFAGGYSVHGNLKKVNFSGCSALQIIEQGGFAYQDKLKSVDLSECTALESLERQMFDQTPKLETLLLPRSLRYVGGYLNELEGPNGDFFRGNTALKSITVDPLNPYYCSENGVWYNQDKTHLLKYPVASEAVEYIAPACLKTIEGQAFQNAKNLTDIDLGQATLSEIRYHAFAGCSNATLSVPFDALGYYAKDGSQCELGANWNQNVKEVTYGEKYKFFEPIFSGIRDGMKVDSTDLTFTAHVWYDDDECTLTVQNKTTDIGATVDNGACAITLIKGVNEIEVTATHSSGKNMTYTFAVECAEKPTVTTTLTDGKTYMGQYIEFDVTAKKADGSALRSAVKIKTDWGYGLNDCMFTTLTDGANGTVHVRIDFDALWDQWIYEGGQFTLAVTVQDGDLSAKVEYRIEHMQSPTFTVTGLSDGYQFSEDVVITVTAKTAGGSAIPAEHIVVQMTLWAGNWVDVTYTVESSSNGVYTLKLSYNSICNNYWNGMMEPFSVAVILTDGNGGELARAEFSNCDI